MGLESFFDHADIVGLGFDAEPAALEFLTGEGGGAAAHEGVEDEVAGATAGADEILDEFERFLRGMADFFLRIAFE